MNKPLISAIAGVVFGVTLCASVFHLRQHGQGARCHSRDTRPGVLMYQPARLLPPPQSFSKPAEVASPVSACSAPAEQLRRGSEQRLSAAQTEYVDGRFDCAMRLARAEIPHQPVRAYRILGAAACQTGNVAVANEAFRHLSSTGRQYLLYVCQRQGVSLGKGRAFPE